MKMNIKKGFTLIELLIVVAIIGILAVALVPTITDAPARARDAARKAASNSVLTALESFNIDNGSYPTGEFCLDTSVAAATYPEGAELVSDYLNGNPPSQAAPGGANVLCEENGNAYVRYESTDGTSYQVFMQLENDGNASIATPVSTDGTANTVNAEGSAGYSETDTQVFLIER